ncbi:RNA-directed DNA polymerase, eukaryota [Tanacetum coccineum]
MGKPINHTDHNGWTWIFRNNKTSIPKPIDNPFHRDVDKVASFFYVTNFPKSLNAKGLWNACIPYGRLVDAFIANKQSKTCKIFGFIRFLAVTDVNEFAKSLSNIWIESYHLLSFASVVHGKPISPKVDSFPDVTRAITFNNQDLIACESFRLLNTIKNISSSIKTISPSFKVDERLIWIEISGLQLCAWGSNAFKKVASLFGKFLFFEYEQSTSMCNGRVCIATKSKQIVFEKVKVIIHGETFEVHAHEIGTWSINIVDASEISSTGDENDVHKDTNSTDANSVDGIKEVLKNLNEGKGDEDPIISSPKATVDDSHSVKEVNNSDLSCPPGFEHMKKESTRRCSTSFAKRQHKDIKGISLIHELSWLIEVGGSLGVDVRGCRKSLNHMISGIRAHIVDK